jgi:hypothetical protein
MTVYEKLEQEFAIAAQHNAGELDDSALEVLIGRILARYPETNPDISVNARLYFNATGSLDGLAEWAAALD